MKAEKEILVDGEWLALRAWLPLSMSWHGWLSFCVLQWFGLRLDRKVVAEHGPKQPVGQGTFTPLVARIRVAGLRFAWPLTGWTWNPAGRTLRDDLVLAFALRSPRTAWRLLRRGPLRTEMLVPLLLSLPTLAAIAAAVWWLL